jgi:TP901 family phage tail tape measure protein
MATLTSKLIVELVDRATAPSRAVASAINRLTAAQTRNAAALAQAQSKMLGAVGMAYALGRAISAPVKAAKDFQTILTDIEQKSGVSGIAFKELGTQLRGIAAATNQLPSDTVKTFDALMALGLGGKTDAENVEAALKLLPAINKTATAFRASNMDVMAAGQAVFANLKVPAEQILRVFDAMAEAGNQGAFELRDMAQYFPEITSKAAALGYQGAKAASDLAAALQVVRQGAGSAGQAATNLSQLFTQMMSPRLANNFKKFGVDLRAGLDAGRKRGLSPIDTLVTLTKTAMKKGARLGDLFREESSFLAIRQLISDVERFHQIRDASNNASGLIDQQYVRRIQDADAALTRFNAAVENLSIELGTGLLPLLTGVIDNGIAPFARAVTEVVRTFPRASGVIVGTAAGLIGLQIAATAAQFAFLWMKGGALAVAAAGLRGVQVVLRGLAFAAWPITAAFGALRAATVGYLASAAILGHGGALKVAAASLLGLISPINLVAGAMRVLRLAVIGTGIGAALVAIAAAGTWIYNNWSGIKEMFSGIWEGFTSALAPVEPALRPVIDGLTWLYDKFTAMTGPIDASKESWRSLGVTIGEALGGAITVVIEKVKALFGLLSSVGSAIGSAGSWAAGVFSPPSAPAAGARALGGAVRAGSPYLVGERGPELFTPAAAGTIQSTSRTVAALRAAAAASMLAATPAAAGTTNNNSISIVVNAAPGQSAENIATEVERVLSARLNALSRGAHSDGVY